MSEERRPIEGLGKVKYPAKEIGYKYRELADGWWQTADFLMPRDTEPTAFEALHDFMVNKIVPSPTAVELAGHFVSRVILLEVEHPKKSDFEYVRIGYSFNHSTHQLLCFITAARFAEPTGGCPLGKD